MVDLPAWLGPAVIGSIFTALGWFASYRSARRLEFARREERIHDFQIALRAEIRSERSYLAGIDIKTHLEQIKARYEAFERYSVLVPQPVRPVIFEAILRNIHVLPADVIDPVVLYARQQQIVASFAADMRTEIFRALSRDRQLEMYADYLGLLCYPATLADQALSALELSLSESSTPATTTARLNTPAQGPSGRRSALGESAVSADEGEGNA